MGKLLRKLKNLAVRLYSDIGNGSLKQLENVAKDGEGDVPGERKRLFRRAAAEGCVLLKNDGILPMAGTIALFGRVQTDTFYTGYGSGGDVIKPYRVSILDGISASGTLVPCEGLASAYRKWQAEHPVNHGYWGNWPRCFPEMPVSEELLAAARAETDHAVVVIGRSAGEDRENELVQGSYYLTDDELRLLRQVTETFPKVAVVLNVGSVPDLSQLVGFGEKIGAILLAWQGGMEAGNAVADVLSGKCSPCGKLADTVACDYSDHPSASSFGGEKYNVYGEDIYVGYRYFETFAQNKALFPFGFGLSYTTFSLESSCSFTEQAISVAVGVRNTGKRAGREVVQVYVKKPDGALGNPARELIAFAKTELLLPDGCQTLAFEVKKSALCSYDDTGLSGFAHSYVLLKGEYLVYVGTDVRSARCAGAFCVDETVCLERTRSLAAPQKITVLCKKGEKQALRTVFPARSRLKERMEESIPQEIPMSENKGYTLQDVVENKVTMSDFVAQLTLDELEAISRGDYTMDSPLGAEGNAGAFGGVTESLRKKGIPPVITTDGPSGIRLKTPASLLPIGTALACTFDCELVERMYKEVGIEMKERGSDVLLAPGMNIHRNPLCGRNFEYFSEDPLLTGKMACAVVRGLQNSGVSACPKHFACNNQETNRNRNDSRLSERALREIYLKGFEICLKEARPHLLMTSYNKINGTWAHYHFDLCRGIVRGEWKYRGCIITDWWMKRATCPQFRKLKNNAYRVRAGVNVLMPGGGYLGIRKPDGTLLRPLGKKGGIALGELQRNAAEILAFLIDSGLVKKGAV